MLTRWLLHPMHFSRSFTNPAESFFIGSFLLSMSVIVGGIQLYGITYGPAYPWLVDAVYILYWSYAAISLVNSIAQYSVLIHQSTSRPIPFTPSVFLAGYSAMLTGTIASLIAGTQPPDRAVLVIYSGCAYQGFGWLISLVCIVFFIRNALDNAVPPAKLRPSLFIPVGSVAYTIVALIGQANAIPSNPPVGYFALHLAAKETLQVVSLFLGVFMWLFSFWLFAIAVVGNVGVIGKMPFSLSWWALVFPNVGFTLATSMIGRELQSEAVLWIASAMTIGLVGVWIVAAVGCVRAVWIGGIMAEGKDEDKDV
jgi:tellurite resistance protein TehA-like permease